MLTPLNASANTAGSLIAGSVFLVPPYQREFAWEHEEVSEFLSDLRKALSQESYFLGLIILTNEDDAFHVVDGQQRLLSLILLAAVLYHEAKREGRKALADRLHSDFLFSMDYQTDEMRPRLSLSNKADNATLSQLLKQGDASDGGVEDGDISALMVDAYCLIRDEVRNDLRDDPFKRLGLWTDFITNKLYFAVFVHPDAASAYRVFEVINTRGRELTTAELLKNYVLSQAPAGRKDVDYERWQAVSHRFPHGSATSLVQYIRHVVTVDAGYILPRDMFDFIARRQNFARQPPTGEELLQKMEERLPLYLQMNDQLIEGPADVEALAAFAAFNSLGVISTRPLLMAMSGVEGAADGIRYLLRLVVRRIVAGNLGTGNVERQFGEAARLVALDGDWRAAKRVIDDLDPSDEAFLEKLKTRSFNKSVLLFLRRSIAQQTMTPEHRGFLHFIAPRNSHAWGDLGEEEIKYWGGTLANTLLSDLERRPKSVVDWDGFKREILPYVVSGEIEELLNNSGRWDARKISQVADELAVLAARVWC